MSERVDTQKRKAPQDDKSGPTKKRKVNKRRNMPFPLAGRSMRASGPPNLNVDPPIDSSAKEDRPDGKPPNKRAKPTPKDPKQPKPPPVRLTHPGYAAPPKPRKRKKRKPLKKSKRKNPTKQDVEQDHLTHTARQFWDPETKKKAFNLELISKIYRAELKQGTQARVVILEISQYLERYLWPNYTSKVSNYEYIMSILLMVNEKFRQSIPVWNIFVPDDRFTDFLKNVLRLKHGETRVKMTHKENQSYVLFLINCLQSFENETIRRFVSRVVNLPLWGAVNPLRRKQYLAEFGQDAMHQWHITSQKLNGKTVVERFIPNLFEEFFLTLESINIPEKPIADFKDARLFCERFVEFVIDLLSALPTRRFFCLYLVDQHFIIRARLSNLGKWSEQQTQAADRLFWQQIDIVEFYQRFPIDIQTGEHVKSQDLELDSYARYQTLQRIAHRHYRDNEEFAKLSLSSIKAFDSRKSLGGMFEHLEMDELVTLLKKLRLHSMEAEDKLDREMMVEMLLEHFISPPSQAEEIRSMPLYPTDQILWDTNVVPTERYDRNSVLALPKLNLQFLTIYDYLLRNFNLFRLESTYEIREDLARCVWRIRPKLKLNEMGGPNKTIFTGYSRMAAPIEEFAITSVAKPKLGEIKPSQVKAEVTIDLVPFKKDTLEDWQSLREHDVMFLLRVKGKMFQGEIDANEGKTRKWGVGNKSWEELTAEDLGVELVRGCEIIEIKDETGRIIGERDMETGNIHQAQGTKRTYVVELDTAQYQIDMTKMAEENTEDPYQGFNLLVRRSAKENNFKAVLLTIRQLMDSKDTGLPYWFKNAFLGYGDASHTQYFCIRENARHLAMNFNDTFLDAEHVVDSFPNHDVKFADKDPQPPFVLKFEELDEPDYDVLARSAKEEVPDLKKVGKITVSTKKQELEGPYDWQQEEPKKNGIRFTPMQVEAIKSGMMHGLTMVVGPPGTGKTDVAVQIVSNLFHQFPNERTLLVTHSNHALNDLFEKIALRDIDESYLLRMGHGAKELDSDIDFSKFGRVAYIAKRREHCLAQAQALAACMKLNPDQCQLCETCEHFFNYHVKSRYEQFMRKIQIHHGDCKFLRDSFPFRTFFLDVRTPLFEGKSWGDDLDYAELCWKHIENIFKEIRECRVFELFKYGSDRGDYLLSRHAKIIAMTCTHAAMKRSEFLKLRMQYDNLVMEEAAQILDVETFIPMLLQKPDRESGCRLKRIILIGDHNQLPPVVKNMAFQKYCKLDQSLYERLIRLGIPTVNLNMQGRARPALAKLYSWRYKHLGNLPNVEEDPQYLGCNPGFAYPFQFVNVPDYQGKGESQPIPFFYQNLGEAEFVVHTYMYMRLVGIPAEKISIITTYNGQKHLLRDVVAARCGNDPIYGWPARVTTVDKFQGQQNDYILLSLVRTNNVGHIRDVRRLVVGLSRARLGLFVFGRFDLFNNCVELQPSFKQFARVPTELYLVPGETYGNTTRKLNDPVEDVLVIENIDRLAGFVYELAEWRRSEYDQNAQTQAEIRRQKEIEAFEQMELDNKREEEERRRTQEAFEMAAEKLRVAMGKETPKQKLGPEKPDWLKKKQDGEAPAEPENANPDDKKEEPKKSDGDAEVAEDEQEKPPENWITLDDDSGEDEESSEEEEAYLSEDES